LRWKEAREFKVGDCILGFDENGRGRKYKNSIIESIEYDEQPVYRVTFESGKEFEVTEDHKWLVVNWVHDRVGRYEWRKTSELNKKRQDGVPKLLNVWDEDKTKNSGWLSGIFDGEGTLYNRGNGSGCAITIVQNEGNILNRIIKTIKTYTQNIRIYNYACGKNGKCRTVRVLGTTNERLEFLGKIRPERLIEKVNFDRLGRLESRNGIDLVKKIELVGKKEIIILGTSTNTFICDGYPMHNCKYNKQDVALLEAVYLKLRPYMPNHPELVSSPKKICPMCGSDKLHSRGWSFTTAFMKKRYRCQGCGKWLLGESVRYKDKVNVLK
jgi:hypothetical protein